MHDKICPLCADEGYIIENDMAKICPRCDGHGINGEYTSLKDASEDLLEIITNIQDEVLYEQLRDIYKAMINHQKGLIK